MNNSMRAFLSKKTLLLFVFLFVNCLFIIKYGERQELVPVYALVVSYIIFTLLVFSFLFYSRCYVNKIKNFNKIFIAIVLFVFFVLLLMNLSVDGNSLNTDRWSALEVGIKNFFNFIYPYDKTDHLGGTTSNLPGLFYIGLPFYLLGDVSLLQPFVFLLLGVFLIKSGFSNIKKLSVVALFLISPAYLWGVFAKSDLLSNMLLLVLFIITWHHFLPRNYFQRTMLLAFFCAIFALTRAVCVAFLISFLLYDFLYTSKKVKLSYILAVLFFVVLLSFPLLVSLPNDFKVIQQHNPLKNQANSSSILVKIVALITPFYIGFRLKTVQEKMYYTHLLLFGVLFYTFISSVIKTNFYNTVFSYGFDISYLNIILPFTIFLLVNFEKKNVFLND